LNDGERDSDCQVIVIFISLLISVLRQRCFVIQFLWSLRRKLVQLYWGHMYLRMIV